MIVRAPYSEIQFNNGFIVIEGVNGAGKSTVSAHCAARLKKYGVNVTKTYEPGDTPLGKQLREILLGEKRAISDQLSELLLFEADRAEHVSQVIKPALKQKQVVICDRYIYSTTAFQGYGRGIELEMIEQLNKIAVGETYPDLVFLLDLEPSEGLRRNKKGAQAGDTFSVDALEHEEIAFHRRIRDGFLEVANKRQEHFVVINAANSLEKVLSEVDSVLDAYQGSSKVSR